MGENLKIKEQQSADKFREQIRHTERDITETVHTLEQRLSPRYVRQRVARKAKRVGWQGTAKLLDFAQRTSVQTSLLGATALLMFIRNRRAQHEIVVKKPAVPETRHPGAKAAGATALWMMLRKSKAQKELAKEITAKKPAVSGIVLAATAAKAFLSGARASKKRGTTRPGRKVAWRGLATAIGAALGSYWYSHKGRRVV